MVFKNLWAKYSEWNYTKQVLFGSFQLDTSETLGQLIKTEYTGAKIMTETFTRRTREVLGTN